MPRADLTIRLHPSRVPYLRADAIRRVTILAIARALREEPTGRDLIDVLDNLGEAALGDTYEGELDALIEDVEALTDMEPACVALSRAELDQLARESADAVNALVPGELRVLPTQPKRGAA
jgi:hypothetical protein